jgi:hypothetical protein
MISICLLVSPLLAYVSLPSLLSDLGLFSIRPVEANFLFLRFYFHSPLWTFCTPADLTFFSVMAEVTFGVHFVLVSGA